MKFLDKLGLILFSMIVLLVTIVISITIAGWLEPEFTINIVKTVLEDGRNIALPISIVLAILALKCIFFNSFSKEEKGNDGILLQNENGKLLVSRDTIENLTNSVVKTFNTAETATTKVEFDENNNISIYITLFVNPDAVIKDLAGQLQTDVKEAIKKSIDLDVKEVNIRIKNITPKKENIVKE